jgi:predicted transglutaminase-like cysteine proteinase
MIRKLIISAVVLTALISGKEANAAGVAGFARSIASTVPQTEFAGLAPAREKATTFTAEKRKDVIRISGAVDEAISQVDAYFDTFANEETKAAAPQGCFDCADLKRDQLVGLGWSADTMRIAYSISDQGRIDRVLVISTTLGDLIVGEGRPAFAEEMMQPAQAATAAISSYYDI